MRRYARIDKRVILSVSRLCSGKSKEDTIKCLNSLMPIRQNLPSEIIIVDTGCRDDVKPLLKEYADEVVEFKWCDDFAKARNAGLKKCSGEWFMFIDDDEWFDNTQPIIDFFATGEYKRYGYTKYVQRNYHNFEGNRYEDFWAGRLIYLIPDTCFVGKIHEYLMPLAGKCKYIDTFANH